MQYIKTFLFLSLENIILIFSIALAVFEKSFGQTSSKRSLLNIYLWFIYLRADCRLAVTQMSAGFYPSSQFSLQFNIIIQTNRIGSVMISVLASSVVDCEFEPQQFNIIIQTNRIGSVMISVLASSVVDCEFEPQTGQTEDYKISICCYSAKHTALRSKSKDWLAQNQDNKSGWTEMSTRRL